MGHKIVIHVKRTPGDRDPVEVEVDRTVLVSHLARMHPQVVVHHRATRRLVAEHASRHYRFSPNHRHDGLLDPGRPASAGNRPVGWYTGERPVTPEEDHAAFLARTARED